MTLTDTPVSISQPQAVDCDVVLIPTQRRIPHPNVSEISPFTNNSSKTPTRIAQSRFRLKSRKDEPKQHATLNKAANK